MKKKRSFLYRNSLSIVLIFCFLLCIVGQIMTGINVYEDELRELGSQQDVTLFQYLRTGHFLQTTFENWESEFLQMGMYVLLTIFLRQVGSSESKAVDKKEEVDREPNPKRAKAPWPVKKGGIYLSIYKNSLSIAFAILFLVSFVLHLRGSLINYNEKQRLKGEATESWNEYLVSDTFWYESFQNWQSEFIAVLSIVVLSIFLRQKGSPESKPVDAPDDETGE
ncbi:MAG TPA: DUF6766 family protein [Chryseolinea sp.]